MTTHVHRRDAETGPPKTTSVRRIDQHQEGLDDRETRAWHGECSESLSLWPHPRRRRSATRRDRRVSSQWRRCGPATSRNLTPFGCCVSRGRSATSSWSQPTTDKALAHDPESTQPDSIGFDRQRHLQVIPGERPVGEGVSTARKTAPLARHSVRSQIKKINLAELPSQPLLILLVAGVGFEPT